MAELWLVSFLAFFAGLIVGIASGYRRWGDKRSDSTEKTACKEMFEPCDPFYVNVKTGEYDFRSSLIRKYGKDEFARMVAYGVYVNELRYQKQLTAEEAKELKNGRRKKQGHDDE